MVRSRRTQTKPLAIALPVRKIAQRAPQLVWAAVLSMAVAASGADLRGRVLDTSGNPVAGAIVFVQEFPSDLEPPAVKRTAVIDQVDKEFVPHVLPVAVGTEVHFPNHDQIHHHVYSFSRTKTFEIPLYKGETTAPVLFDKAGAVKVGCNIHDWMSAVILVLPTPYFATTDDSGTFLLSGLPPGRYVLGAWHEGSRAKVEDTFQTVAVDARSPDVSFSLPVTAPRPRPGAHGMRSYE
jgi:plastocyanin